VAFLALRQGAVRLVLDGLEHPYDDLGVPVFSPDGQRLAFSVREGDRWYVDVDGERGPAFDYIGPLWLYVGTPIFSADGSRVAYAGQRDEKWVAVVDGQAGQPFDVIMLIGFDEHNRLVYLATRAGELFRVAETG
jgi:hypothetical protein